MSKRLHNARDAINKVASSYQVAITAVLTDPTARATITVICDSAPPKLAIENAIQVLTLDKNSVP